MLSMKVYVDTSVFGGLFDEEFSSATEAFFQLVRLGRFELFVSDVVAEEISHAPAEVQKAFQDMLPGGMTIVPVTEELLQLRDEYIRQGILTEKSADDAAHVAAATLGSADIIVSWNFRHIVHYQKIRMYNAVNAMRGYHSLDIRSPAEVIDYEEEENI
jgi:predicted nucleic acid-binding protein